MAIDVTDTFPRRAPHIDQVDGLGAPPTRTREGKAIDKRIERVYAKVGNGVQINIMDIPKVFVEGRKAIAAGADDAELERVLAAYLSTIRMNGVDGLGASDYEKDPSKEKFHRFWLKYLRQFAQNYLGLNPSEFTVRSNKGGPAVLGEVTLHTDKLYVMVGGLDQNQLMFRSVKSRKDYTGGANHWMQTQKLIDDPIGAAEAFRRVMGEPSPGVLDPYGRGPNKGTLHGLPMMGAGDDDFEADGPQEEDWTTEDHQNFYVVGGSNRRPVVSVREGDDMWAALNAEMHRQGMFPNVWFISDHGNAHMLLPPDRPDTYGAPKRDGLDGFNPRHAEYMQQLIKTMGELHKLFAFFRAKAGDLSETFQDESLMQLIREAYQHEHSTRTQRYQPYGFDTIHARRNLNRVDAVTMWMVFRNGQRTTSHVISSGLMQRIMGSQRAPGAALLDGISLTYGVMPSFEVFEAAFDKVMEGRRYRIQLGQSDSRAADGTSIGDGDYSSRELYRGVAELAQKLHYGVDEDPTADDAGSLASSILETLGFEWI